MDFREFKKLVAFAQRRGAKRVRGGDFEVEFEHAGVPSRPNEKTQAERESKPVPVPQPTLEEIQNWIHAANGDPHEPH